MKLSKSLGKTQLGHRSKKRYRKRVSVIIFFLSLQNIEKILVKGFGKFHYALIFVSGIFMASSFYETMGVNYILPVAECDLNITSKQQYGIISGIWFVGMYSEYHQV